MDIYRDIAERTGGDIYIGVVGPVRTGKSTFISRFMQKLVLPAITDENARLRATDELPQSADGKTIMTTQPRFIPGEAVPVDLKGVRADVRLIDCVGYLAEGALGHMEESRERMVRTPWSNTEMPFSKAAEIGTQKVVTEHSTVAVVVTTDGSFSEIAREGYVKAEERVVAELKDIGKPFVIVLNSSVPESEMTQALADSLRDKYDSPVIVADVTALDEETITAIMGGLLSRFPVRKIEINTPVWMRKLPSSHPVIAGILSVVREGCGKISAMSECGRLFEGFSDADIESAEISSMDMGKGTATYELKPEAGLYYRLLSELAGTDISDDFTLMSFITDMAAMRSKFERVSEALSAAEDSGYGVVTPPMEEMNFMPPEIVKRGNRYGVIMKASAPVYHIMKVDVTTEVSPVTGSEEQSRYMLGNFEENPEKLWNTDMFGKTLQNVAREGLSGMAGNMPAELQNKLRRVLGRIINENKSGMLCFLY